MAFQDSSEKHFTIKNEKFLGPVQLHVLYDEVIGEHL
jgi:hypothetical protein